jgi:hypothetical protein
MVSDGTRYQVYSNQKDELYTEGLEDGPPYKKFDSLGDTLNQLINIRPGTIQEAMLFDATKVLGAAGIKPGFSDETVREPDQARRCKVVTFHDVSGDRVHPVQAYWFDLATTDVWRRKTFSKTGAEETEAIYLDYEQVSPTLRYPSQIAIHFVNTDTWVRIELDPMDMNFAVPPPEVKFAFDTHGDAKNILKFEPLENGPVAR